MTSPKPESPVVAEFTALANRLGLRPSADQSFDSFGDRLIEYSGARLGLRLTCDRSQWSIDVFDREGRPEEWYDAAILRDLVRGAGEDVLSIADQLTIVEDCWREIAARFEPSRRDETHARLSALRKERVRRMFPGLAP